MRSSGKDLYLRLLSPEDIDRSYVEWMRDEAVTGFLESRWTVYGIDDLKAYAKKINEDPNAYLFGIFLKGDARWIGNIKIGGIHWLHRYGDLGLLIGEPALQGRGYGTEAIRLATRYAFEDLNLHKLVAGIYAGNAGSLKAFLKAGYKEVGRLTAQRFCGGQYVDEILVEKMNA